MFVFYLRCRVTAHSWEMGNIVEPRKKGGGKVEYLFNLHWRIEPCIQELELVEVGCGDEKKTMHNQPTGHTRYW